MAKKLPLAQVGIAAGVGVGAYLLGTQLSKSVAWVGKNWYAVPAVLIGGGLLVAKKHPPIGLAAAGAGGALGYFQYAAHTGQVAQPGAPAVATTTTAAAPITPVVATTPTTAPNPAPAAPVGTSPGGTGNSTLSQGISAATTAIQGLGGGTTPTSTGTTPGGTGNSTTTPTTAQGYSAGLLRSGPPMHSNLATWRRGAVGAGALMHGPAPSAHMAQWRRGAVGAGHYSDSDAAGLES